MKQLTRKYKSYLAIALLSLSSVLTALPWQPVLADTPAGVLTPGLATQSEKITFHLKTNDTGRTYRLSRIDIYDGLTNIKSVLIQFPENATFSATVPEGFSCENDESESTRSYIIQNGTTPSKVEKFLQSVQLTAKNEQVTGDFTVSVNEALVSSKQDEAGNKHYYQFFPTSKTWLNAFNAAVLSDPDGDGIAGYHGLKGHLATINSPEEQDFIFNSISHQSGWLGGTRAKYKNGSDTIDIGSLKSLNPDGTLKSTSINDYDLTSSVANKYYWTGGAENGVIFYNSHIHSTSKDNRIPDIFSFFNQSKANMYIKRGTNAYYYDGDSSNLQTGDVLANGTENEPNAYAGKEAFLEYAHSVRGENIPMWNDYANTDTRGYYVEYEETDEIKEEIDTSSRIVEIKATPNSIFENKSQFPLTAGNTRLILNKIKMDEAGVTIQNNGAPSLNLNGAPINGTKFSIYELSTDFKTLLGQAYNEVAQLAPSLSAKAANEAHFSLEDASTQLQYQITQHLTVLTDGTKFADITPTGASFTTAEGQVYQENGRTFVDVPTTSENGGLRVYAIVQRDSNDESTLYYEQPLIVGLPVLNEAQIEQDMIYLYPKGFGEEVTKTLLGGGSLPMAVAFGDYINYQIKIPIPKDIDQKVNSAENANVAVNKYQSLSIIDEYPVGIVPSSYYNWDSWLNWGEHGYPSPYFGDLSSRRTDLGNNQYQITFTGDDIETLKSFKGRYLTISVSAQVTNALAVNQPQTTQTTYLADFYDETATDTKLFAESESIQTSAVKFINQDETGKAIQGHEFIIANGDGTGYLYQSGSSYYFTNKANATTFTTDANGEIVINGLKADTYTLLQTKALNKYRPIQNQAAKILNQTDNHFNVTLKTETDYELFDRYEVINYHRGSLPTTGKLGAVILILVSLIGMYTAYRGVKKLRQTRSIEIDDV